MIVECTNNNGKPFVVGNVLHLSSENSSSFLVETFIVPVRVNVRQLSGN